MGWKAEGGRLFRGLDGSCAINVGVLAYFFHQMRKVGDKRCQWRVSGQLNGNSAINLLNEGPVIVLSLRLRESSWVWGNSHSSLPLFLKCSCHSIAGSESEENWLQNAIVYSSLLRWDQNMLYLRVGQLELTLKQTYEDDMIYTAQRFVNCLRRGGCDRRTDHEQRQ